MKTLEKFRFAGIVGIIVYWLFVAWSISRNPWFSMFHNALSDLGDPAEASSPWIYNYGLIVTSLFVLAFSIYLIWVAKNKVQTIGGAYISISAIFLALIGVFHSGTQLHVFVSTYFFIQFFLGMLIFGLGTSERVIKYSAIVLFILALLGTFVDWPSVAIEETYEITLIAVFTTIVVLRCSKGC
ncbi:DUF998 domain-containing protein [Thermococcus sp. M39]|nr:DUF998 domain-containing protein [Thermococcus sp. M39]NJE09015.1 DUF998 domain-containing protein [Thermococcus sp. M39]NJE13320.1 DUF998 domain-containing protein [Thermococcus sp. LS2]